MSDSIASHARMHPAEAPVPNPVAPRERIPPPRRSVGNELLDFLLQGGVPGGSLYLLLGPAYCGKEAVVASFARAAACAGEPLVVVLTNMTPARFRADVARLGGELARHEATGRVAYVDCYADAVGWGARDPFVVATPTARDPAAMMDALLEAIEQADGEARIVIDSISDLVLRGLDDHDGAAHLQRLTGVARARGLTGLLTADAGIHAPSRLALLQHRADGTIEFRERDDGRSFLRVRGGGGGATRDWVEYVASADGLDIVGSFTEQKVR